MERRQTKSDQNLTLCLLVFFLFLVHEILLLFLDSALHPYAFFSANMNSLPLLCNFSLRLWIYSFKMNRIRDGKTSFFYIYPYVIITKFMYAFLHTFIVDRDMTKIIYNTRY